MEPDDGFDIIDDETPTELGHGYSTVPGTRTEAWVVVLDNHEYVASGRKRTTPKRSRARKFATKSAARRAARHHRGATVLPRAEFVVRGFRP